MARAQPFNVPYLTHTEAAYLLEVIETRSFAGNGTFTKRVQRLLESRFDAAHVLLTHSCTGALELAALLLGTGPGDEVIVPSYTFVSSASAFLRTGATVVFCEVDPATMNIDVDDVERRLTERTKVIVPVHYAGVAADMDRLAAIVSGTDISLVEDAAQGVGAFLGDRALGTIGRLGAVSFHETKNIHSGLGGALYVNDPDLFDRAENIWERGTDRSKMIRGVVDKYSWVELGSSFYPSELQAAFLLAQLESIDENSAERELLHARYRTLLEPLAGPETFLLPPVPADRTTNHHAFFMTLPSVDALEAMQLALRAEDIHAHTHYVPLHSSPMGLSLGNRAEDLPITEDLAPRVLRLPLHNEMTIDDVERTCALIAGHVGA